MDTTKTASTQIKHVIVLMFENRSFDHILGAMPGVNGVLNTDGTIKSGLFNTPNPLSEPEEGINTPVLPTLIDLDGQTAIYHDFNHDFGDGMMPDLFGPGTTGYVAGQPVNAPATTYPPTNSGFLSTIAWNADPSGQTPNGPGAMTCFKFGALNVLHRLASEFVVCDNWHCDMPGHTEPNRAFMHCATTGDVGIDDSDGGTVNRPTIFQMLERQNRSWKMYTPGGQVDTTWINAAVRNSPNTNVPISQFCQDAQQGTLPFYSFLMCWSANGQDDTSMHPASQLEPGENYLAAVYNALRGSKSWEDTLLIVTFDENGGIYDHVVPPQTVSPFAPGEVKHGTTTQGQPTAFDFTLLGLRVPALLISPWLAKGKVESTQYQTTSILRFIESILLPPTEPIELSLTPRDARAPNLLQALDRFWLPDARTDCPPSLELYPGFGGGNISGTSSIDPARAAEPPKPHLLEMTLRYVGGLPGHADSGKPVTRSFPSNASLNAYAEERLQAARLYDADHPA